MSRTVFILAGLILIRGFVFGQSAEHSENTTQSKSKTPVERYIGWAATTGLWIPQGHNRLSLGIHPSLGIMADGWYGKVVYDVAIEFRFIKAEREYTVQYQGAPEKTNHYFGGFIGLHVGYAFLNSGNNSVYGLGGFGLDGFDAIEEDYQHENSVSINAFNKNVGIGIRHFDNKGRFIGIEILYNFINYKNPGGSPLDGNGFSVRLLFGGVRFVE